VNSFFFEIISMILLEKMAKYFCFVIKYMCSFYRCEFDPANGGEMTQLEYHNFLKPEEAF
jgi:hypothetical protein